MKIITAIVLLLDNASINDDVSMTEVSDRQSAFDVIEQCF